MRFTEEDALSIKAFRSRSKILLEQGNEEDARQLGIYALQIINRTTVNSIKNGDLSTDEQGQPTDDFMFTDIPAKEAMHWTSGKRSINLTLLLVEESALTKEILTVLEKYIDGGNNADRTSELSN